MSNYKNAGLVDKPVNAQNGTEDASEIYEKLQAAPLDLR
jgi:hypothetical protein